MARESYRAIARIVKTIGKAGEVVALAADGLPFLVTAGLELWPVPPALRGPRSFVVSRVQGDGDSARIALAGIDDLNAASALVGKTLLARESDLPTDLDLRDRRRVLGLSVVDESYGVLGKVAEVLAGAYQDVWVVRGERGEILVPVAPELVTIEDGQARTHLPKGLVEEGEA